MSIAGGVKENGIFVGNIYDKYGSKNPFVRLIMNGFQRSLQDLVDQVAPKSIHEIGCGEGYWVLQWIRQNIDACGSDFSAYAISIAQKQAATLGLPEEIFKQRNIYDLAFEEDSADLIICCEVLEHLEDPEEGLATLQKVVKEYIILSVPIEPLWRVLNCLRGKYLLRLGDTPGHIQHWSSSGFRQLVAQYFDIIEVKIPLPWTMVLGRVKR